MIALINITDDQKAEIAFLERFPKESQVGKQKRIEEINRSYDGAEWPENTFIERKPYTQ